MKLDFESNTTTFMPVGSEVADRLETENYSAEATAKMLREGIEAAQNGKSSEARNLLLRVTEAEPNNEKAWLWLASISEYPEELLVFLNNVLKINPENERAIEWAKATKSLLSKTFVQRGIDAANEPGDFAKQCFSQAISYDENNEMAWLWLASVTASEEEKEAHLQKVLSINAENETAKNLLDSSQKKKCEEIFQKALGYAVEGENAEALAALEEYFAASADKEDALVLKSFLVASFAEKLECFDRILEFNAENELAQRNAAYLRTMMQKPEAETSRTAESENEPALPAAEENTEDFASEAEEAQAGTEDFFASEENHFADETAEETPMLELEVPQYETEEEFSLADEVETQAEHAEMESRFEEPQAEEMQFEQLTSTEAENLEMPDEFPAETENDEKGYAFYEADDYAAPQNSHRENESPAFADYESETGSYENVQELTQNYDFQTSAPQSEDGEASDVYEIEAVAENNYSHLFEAEKNQPEELQMTSAGVSEENFEAAKMETPSYYGEEDLPEPPAEMETCGFCNAANEAHSLTCFSCRAVLTLADLEMILANQEADREMIGNAICRIETMRETRDLSADEFKQIALGYLNVGDLPKGLNYLSEAAKIAPNDFVLSGQINSLKIRQSEIEKQNAAHDAMPKNLTILVVDDSATVRKLISGKLEKSGHAVVCAMDGVDALEKIKEIVPDLVLLDINMPRMDGYQVCKMIRSNDSTKDVPVVMISGKDGFFDKVRGRMAGTTGYITKPFGPETLMKTVETYIV